MWAYLSLGATIINQSVGVVGDQIVTAREVQVAQVIDRVIEAPEGKVPAVSEVPIKDAKFADLVSTFLLEKAAVNEAVSFSVADVDDKLLKDMGARLEKAVAGKAFWQKLDVSPEFVRNVLRTKLIAKNFIKIKADSMAGLVTDDEAKAYFEKNRLKFGTETFEAFKENIKTYLVKKQKEDRLRSWFEVLRRKHKVRNIIIENAKTPEDTANS